VRLLLATPGTDVGGAERVVITLAQELPARGHEVVLWGPAGALEPELAGERVRRIAVPSRGRSPAGVAEGIASLAATIRRVRPQVVHAHNPRVAALAGLGARLARGPRRPGVLATFHGVRHTEYRAASLLLRGADAVTCVSEDLVAGLRDAGLPADRLHVIANSVRVPTARDPGRDARLDAELALGGAVVIIAVGRLVEQKNHARFIAAAAEVAAARPDARFLIVGDGPLRAELAAQARSLGLEDRLTLTGVRRDVPALAARADLVVFSSDWEGLSLVALEALAAGTPVLSTPVEGMRDLLEGGAVTLTDAATASDLARGMLDLLADPARLALLGGRGRELVAARYSTAAMLDGYERLYRALSR
jgi:glycosyltransferase involved in cell wall biosynthesis